VAFTVVESVESSDEKGKVRGVGVFNTKVIHHEDEGMKVMGRMKCRKKQRLGVSRKPKKGEEKRDKTKI
jgi:hypothetical protein